MRWARMRRTALALAVCLTAPTLMTGTARAADPLVASFERFPISAVALHDDPSVVPPPLISTRDGTSWVRGFHEGALGLVRIGSRGDVERFALPDVDITSQPYGPLTVLADGSVGFVAPRRTTRDGPGGDSLVEWVLVRMAPTGSVPTVTPLVETPWVSSQAVLAVDGTAWIASDCRHRIVHVTPGGRVARFRVPGRRCKPALQPQPRLAIGQDGTVWYVDLAEGVIARFARNGGQRSWRYVPRRSAYVPPTRRIPPTPIHATSGGGLRFPGGRIDAGGALRLDGSAAPHVVTSDGAVWTVVGPATVERVRHAATRRFTLPESSGTLIGWTAGPDGRFWYLAGRTRFGMPRRTWDVRIGAIDAGGRIEEQALPPADPAVAGPTLTTLPWMTAGPDGTIWVGEVRILVAHPDASVSDLLRVAPFRPTG